MNAEYIIVPFAGATIITAIIVQIAVVFMVGVRAYNEERDSLGRRDQSILLLIATLVLIIGLVLAAFLTEADFIPNLIRAIVLCVLAGSMLFISVRMAQWSKELTED